MAGSISKAPLSFSFTIPWKLSVSPRAKENPHSWPLRRRSSEQAAMAFRRIDPEPFIPRGMDWEEVPNRVQSVRVVSTREQPRNEDVSIVSFHPLPLNQVDKQMLEDEHLSKKGKTAAPVRRK
ncbi:hypothetical protein BS78_07G052100 [Paspalum vaginatum]|nr:hypothetical protein BS78_07G052100 [Paspalum vaginatum]